MLKHGGPHMELVARKNELMLLHRALEKRKSQFIAVYGRRRVQILLYPYRALWEIKKRTDRSIHAFFIKGWFPIGHRHTGKLDGCF